MNRIKLKLLFVLVLFSAASISSLKTTASPIQGAVSFQFFYNELSPYGSWVSYPDYGYVWVPAHRVGFRPYYTNGHWVYTDMGWMWVSDYDWGWAPFHYGSWTYDSFYGWVWVPGYDWAPAWVEWGSYGGYYGWAPMGPRYTFGAAYYPPVEHWVFVHPRHMMAADWSSHSYVARNHRISISDNTVITDANRVSIVDNRNNYNNRQYYAGPPRQEVERSARTTVQPVVIKERDKPGKTEINGNSMNVYRPRVNKDEAIAKPLKVQPRQERKAAQASAKTETSGGSRGRERVSEVSPIPERNQPVHNQPALPGRNQPANHPQQQKENKVKRMPVEKSQQPVTPEKQMDYPPKQNSIQPQREHQQPVNTPSRGVKPMRSPHQNLQKAPVERRQITPPVPQGGQDPQEAKPREKK